MKLFKLILAATVLLSSIGCNNSIPKKNGRIVIDGSEKIKTILLKKDDSVEIRIVLDSALNFKSIYQTNRGIIEGQALIFYPDGRLEKKVLSEDGIRMGRAQYFYESGALKGDLYFYNGRPNVYGVEYWDGKYGLTKYSIHFDEHGKIEKMKVYDSLGYYIKDSVPPYNSEYPANY